jgi:hypothetical protein
MERRRRRRRRRKKKQTQCALVMHWLTRTGGSSRTRGVTGESSAGHHI